MIKHKFIYIVIFCFIIPYTVKAQDKIFNYKDFLKNLPEINPDSGTLIDIETEQFWEEFSSVNNDIEKINKSYNKSNNLFFIPPPNINQIMNLPLIYKGDTIKEFYVNKRNKAAAQVFCHKGKPAIRYFKMKKFTQSCIAFFRMHEYAHIILEHLKCGEDIYGSHEKEYAADKKAVEILEGLTDGIRVIDNIAATFFIMNTRSSKTHPKSRERAKRFYETNMIKY